MCQPAMACCTSWMQSSSQVAGSLKPKRAGCMPVDASLPLTWTTELAKHARTCETLEASCIPTRRCNSWNGPQWQIEKCINIQRERERERDREKERKKEKRKKERKKERKRERERDRDGDRDRDREPLAAREYKEGAEVMRLRACRTLPPGSAISRTVASSSGSVYEQRVVPPVRTSLRNIAMFVV